MEKSIRIINEDSPIEDQLECIKDFLITKCNYTDRMVIYMEDYYKEKISNEIQCDCDKSRYAYSLVIWLFSFFRNVLRLIWLPG